VWTTKPEHFRDGQRRPGPATAMAFMVSKKGGKTSVFQWNDDVQLE
jgi:hypothetical protein